MHADVFKTAFFSYISQLLLPVGSQSFIGPAGSNAFFEKGIQGSCRLAEINIYKPFLRESLILFCGLLVRQVLVKPTADLSLWDDVSNVMPSIYFSDLQAFCFLRKR